MREKIVITMPLKNAGTTVEKSIRSFQGQRHTKRERVLLIGNDQSTDDSASILDSFIPDPSITVLEVNLGKTWLNRNYLKDYARKHIPGCVLIGRLDADDVLMEEDTLAKVEAVYEETRFDVLLGGNKQQQNGKILEWENRVDIRLMDDRYLLQRLYEMSIGNPKAELPSCNTFVRPSVEIAYPPKESAEDHWFTVMLLLAKKKLKIHIEEDLLYCIYSLDGKATASNMKKKLHLESRTALLEFFKRSIET